MKTNFFLILALSLPLAAQTFRTVGETTSDYKAFEQTLETRRQTFGENSAPYAAALVDLARAYQSGGKRSADAMRLYQQALPIQESVLGPEHPDVATTLFYLAMGTPRDEEHAQQARQLFERALAIRTKAFGASDVRVAEILTPLARLTEDETLFQRAMTIVDAAEPQSPLAAATTMELYSRYLTAHDRGREAEPLETRAKQIRTARVAEIGSKRPSMGPQAQRVGSGVTAPKLKQKTEPEYSDIARADKLQGTVVLMIEVGVDGLAHNIQLKRGVGLGLDEKAAEAIGKWQFIPGTRDGQPVPVIATIEVNFRLM